MRKKKKRTKRKSKSGRPSSFQTIERDADNPDQVEVREYLVRLNVQFVMVMIILLVTCATGMHFFHDYQLTRKADYYLEFASQAEENQDWKTAKQYLFRYYSLRTDDLEILERLCLLSWEHPSSNKELINTYKNFGRVLREFPNKHTTRWKTAKLAMIPVLSRMQDAIQHFEYLERHLEDLPEDISLKDILSQKALAFHLLKNGSRAIKTYQRVLAIDSTNVDAYYGLVYLLLDEDMKFENFNKELESIDPLKQKHADKIEVADRLVDRLVKLGQPADEALIFRTRYTLLLRPTETFEKVIPSPSTASQSAAQLLATYDLDHNHKLDSEDLDPKKSGIAWINTNQVPSSADFNRDGTLTLKELEQWYRDGERISRLKMALADLETIIIKNKFHTRALRFSTQLEYSLASEYLSFGKKDLAKQHVTKGKKLAKIGLSLDPPDLNSYLNLSSLENISRSFDIENSKKYREQSIDYLRDGIQALGNLQRSSNSELSITNGLGVNENREDILSDREIEKLDKEFHWRLADRLLSSLSLLENDAESREEIESEIEKQILWLEQTNPRDFLLDFLRGQVSIIDRKWRNAISHFANIPEHDAEYGGLKRRLVLYLAECYEQLENPDESRRFLTQQLEDDPGWVGGTRMLAASLSDSGEFSRAIRQYIRISSIPGIPLAIARARYRELVRLPVKSRDWTLVSAALNAEEKMHNNRDDKEFTEILLVRVSALLAQAEESIVQNTDGSKSGTMSKNLYFQALKLLQDGIDSSPKKSDLRYGLIVLNLEHPEKKPEQQLKLAKKNLAEARKVCGESLDLFRAEALILRDENPPNTATKLADLIANRGVQKFDRNQQVQFANSLLREVSRLDRDKNNSEEIDKAREKLLLHLATLLPDSMFPQTQLVELALNQGDRDLFRQHLTQLKRVEGNDGPNAMYAEAYSDLIAIEKNLDGSKNKSRKYTEQEREELSRIKEKLRKITRLRTRWSEPHRLIGNIEYALGNRVSAIDAFEAAFRRESTDTTMISRLVRLLMAESRLEEANSILATHVQRRKQMTSPEINRLAWRVAWKRKMSSEALGIARKVAEQTKNYRDKLLQAQMSAVTGIKRREVEKLYQDAIALALIQSPENAHNSYLTFVIYLKGIKSFEFARQQIKLAEKNLPAKPQWQKQLTLAQCNEAIEEFGKAEKQYLQALSTAEKKSNLLYEVIGFYSRRNNYDRAKKFADDLMKLDAEDSIKRWAKARLAVLKATNLSFENVVEGLKELELNFNDEEKRMPGFLRTKAQILSRKISHAGRIEQIENLEKLRKVTKLTTAEAFRLALLYDLTNQDEEYEKIIKMLLAENYIKPTYVAQYASWLTVRKRFDEAKTQLLKLEQLMPNTLVSVGTRIRFHFAKGEKELGLRAAKDFLEKFKKKRGDFRFSSSLDSKQLKQTLLELDKNPALKDQASMKRLERIQSLIEDSRTEAATSLLKELIQQKQLQTWAGNLTVQLLASQIRNFGEIAEARNLFNTYYDFKRNPQGRLFVATLLADEGHIDKALAAATAAEKFVRLESMADFYSTMIHKNVSKEQFASIENWFKTTLEKQPESVVMLNALAEISVLKSDFAQAISFYRNLLKISPTHIGALNNLAWILSQSPRTASEANLLIVEALKMAGPTSELLDTQGLVHLALENPQKAILDFQQAISEFPAPEYYFHLSLAYFRMNNLSKARENLKTALDRGFSPGSLMPAELKDYQEMQSRLAK